MKSINLKRIIVGIVCAMFMAASVVAIACFGVKQPQTAKAQAPVITMRSSPVFLTKSNPYREFTITVRLEGISDALPGGGLYGAEIRLTPTQAELLEFVRLVPSTDVLQSATTRNSQHKEGKFIDFDAGNNGISPVTEDFDVGGYTFRLKQGVEIPDSLEFVCEDLACADMMANGIDATSTPYVLYIRNLG